MRRTTVSDVMTSSVLSVAPEASVDDIAAVLHRGAVRAVPVIEDDGLLVGVVSEADLLAAAERTDPGNGDPGNGWHRMHRPRHTHRHHPRAKSGATTARELMTAPAAVIAPDASVAAAARAMQEHGMSWLPVVGDDGQVTGVLGRSDLLAVFHRADALIRTEIVGDLLERMLMVHPLRVVVEVTEGVVIMTGVVDTWSDKELALRFAERIEGVVRVVDNLSFRVDGRFAPLRSFRDH